MEKMAIVDPNQGKVVKLDAILNQSVTTGSNLKHTVDDLHDILHSYYKVARKRFVDVVCMQSADHHLVTGPDAPTRVFSPNFVSELTNDQLEAIAGEDLVSKRKREDLKRKIENLEAGKKIALTYRWMLGIFCHSKRRDHGSMCCHEAFRNVAYFQTATTLGV